MGSKSGGNNIWPPISNEERARHESLFYSQGPMEGLLAGEPVRELFLRSKLPLPILSQVWNLVDVPHDNMLDSGEFVVAMHLIQGYLTGRKLPQALPDTLKPRPTEPIKVTRMTKKEFTAYRKLYEVQNKDRTGTVNAKTAKKVFMTSHLPLDELAMVWDRADVDRDGRLSGDEFAIACHLVRFLKKGNSIKGCFDVLALLPHRTPKNDLEHKRARMSELTTRKQKLMAFRERRKTEMSRESKRLQLAKECFQLMQQKAQAMQEVGILSESDEEVEKKLSDQCENIRKMEAVSTRLKKEQERVRQETAKVIMEEQRMSQEVKALEDEAEKLRKKRQRNSLIKDLDPFHQLHEQRKEEKLTGVRATKTQYEVHIPQKVDPFDKDQIAIPPLSGEDIFVTQDTNVDQSSAWKCSQEEDMFELTKGFEDNFMEVWSSQNTSKSMSSTVSIDNDFFFEDEDPVFKTVSVTEEEDDLWCSLPESVLASQKEEIQLLQDRLTEVTNQMTDLAKEGDQLVFRNPEDYDAHPRGREDPHRELTRRHAGSEHGQDGEDQDVSTRRRSYAYGDYLSRRGARENLAKRRSVDNNTDDIQFSLRQERNLSPIRDGEIESSTSSRSYAASTTGSPDESHSKRYSDRDFRKRASQRDIDSVRHSVGYTKQEQEAVFSGSWNDLTGPDTDDPLSLRSYAFSKGYNVESTQSKVEKRRSISRDKAIVEDLDTSDSGVSEISTETCDSVPSQAHKAELSNKLLLEDKLLNSAKTSHVTGSLETLSETKVEQSTDKSSVDFGSVEGPASDSLITRSDSLKLESNGASQELSSSVDFNSSTETLTPSDTSAVLDKITRDIEVVDKESDTEGKNSAESQATLSISEDNAAQSQSISRSDSSAKKEETDVDEKLIVCSKPPLPSSPSRPPRRGSPTKRSAKGAAPAPPSLGRTLSPEDREKARSSSITDSNSESSTRSASPPSTPSSGRSTPALAASPTRPPRRNSSKKRQAPTPPASQAPIPISQTSSPGKSSTSPDRCSSPDQPVTDLHRTASSPARPRSSTSPPLPGQQLPVGTSSTLSRTQSSPARHPSPSTPRPTKPLSPTRPASHSPPRPATSPSPTGPDKPPSPTRTTSPSPTRPATSPSPTRTTKSPSPTRPDKPPLPNRTTSPSPTRPSTSPSPTRTTSPSPARPDKPLSPTRAKSPSPTRPVKSPPPEDTVVPPPPDQSSSSCETENKVVLRDKTNIVQSSGRARAVSEPVFSPRTTPSPELSSEDGPVAPPRRRGGSRKVKLKDTRQKHATFDETIPAEIASSVSPRSKANSLPVISVTESQSSNNNLDFGTDFKEFCLSALAPLSEDITEFSESKEFDLSLAGDSNKNNTLTKDTNIKSDLTDSDSNNMESQKILDDSFSKDGKMTASEGRGQRSRIVIDLDSPQFNPMINKSNVGRDTKTEENLEKPHLIKDTEESKKAPTYNINIYLDDHSDTNKENTDRLTVPDSPGQTHSDDSDMSDCENTFQATFSPNVSNLAEEDQHDANFQSVSGQSDKKREDVHTGDQQSCTASGIPMSVDAAREDYSDDDMITMTKITHWEASPVPSRRTDMPPPLPETTPPPLPETIPPPLPEATPPPLPASSPPCEASEHKQFDCDAGVDSRTEVKHSEIIREMDVNRSSATGTEPDIVNVSWVDKQTSGPSLLSEETPNVDSKSTNPDLVDQSSMDPRTGLKKVGVSDPVSKAMSFVEHTEMSFKVRRKSDGGERSEEIEVERKEVLEQMKVRKKKWATDDLTPTPSTQVGISDSERRYEERKQQQASMKPVASPPDLIAESAKITRIEPGDIDSRSISDQERTKQHWEEKLASGDISLFPRQPEPAKRSISQQSLKDFQREVEESSIADLESTKRHWEKKVAESEKEKEKPSTKSNKFVKSASHNTLSYSYTKGEVDDAGDNESAIDREIRLALEREQSLKAEKEKIIQEQHKPRQNLSKSTSMPIVKVPPPSTQVVYNDTSTTYSNSHSPPHPTYREMTEADRGSEISKRESIIEREIREQQKREEALRMEGKLKGPQSTNKEREQSEYERQEKEHERINAHESIIERDIRLQQEREQSFFQEHGHHKPVSHSNTIVPAEPAPLAVQVEPHPTYRATPPVKPVETQISTSSLNMQSSHRQTASPDPEQVSYEDAIAGTLHQGESIIARELREQREREEELLRSRSSLGLATPTSPVASESILSLSSPQLYNETQQRVPPPVQVNTSASPQWSPGPQAIKSPERPVASVHATIASPADTYMPSSTADTVPKYEEPAPLSSLRHETPIEREIRLAREREEEFRVMKGLAAVVQSQEGVNATEVNIDESDHGNARRPVTLYHKGDARDEMGTLKRLATGRLQKELARERLRENHLRQEGKITTTSEQHVGEVKKYVEVTPPEVPTTPGGSVKPKTPTSANKPPTPVSAPPVSKPLYQTPEVHIIEKTAPPQQVPNGNVNSYTTAKPSSPVVKTAPPMRTPPPAQINGGQRFTIRRSQNPAETKIEQELREMREREEELRRQRGLQGTEVRHPTSPTQPGQEKAESSEVIFRNKNNNDTSVKGPRRKSALAEQWERKVAQNNNNA